MSSNVPIDPNAPPLADPVNMPAPTPLPVNPAPGNMMAPIPADPVVSQETPPEVIEAIKGSNDENMPEEDQDAADKIIDDAIQDPKGKNERREKFRKYLEQNVLSAETVNFSPAEFDAYQKLPYFVHRVMANYATKHVVNLPPDKLKNPKVMKIMPFFEASIKIVAERGDRKTKRMMYFRNKMSGLSRYMRFPRFTRTAPATPATQAPIPATPATIPATPATQAPTSRFSNWKLWGGDKRKGRRKRTMRGGGVMNFLARRRCYFIADFFLFCMYTFKLVITVFAYAVYFVFTVMTLGAFIDDSSSNANRWNFEDIDYYRKCDQMFPKSKGGRKIKNSHRSRKFKRRTKKM